MGKVHVRPTWDEYFLGVLRMTAARASCGRGRSGCVIVKNRHIVATGYVGALPGMKSCDDVGHLLKRTLDFDTHRVEVHCVRTVHAEQNAICQAAKLGLALEGAELYCTMTPCRTCAMLIVQSGIKTVHCARHYSVVEQEDHTLSLLRDCGVDVSFEDASVQEYENDAG